MLQNTLSEVLQSLVAVAYAEARQLRALLVDDADFVPLVGPVNADEDHESTPPPKRLAGKR